MANHDAQMWIQGQKKRSRKFDHPLFQYKLGMWVCECGMKWAHYASAEFQQGKEGWTCTSCRRHLPPETHKLECTD